MLGEYELRLPARKLRALGCEELSEAGARIAPDMAKSDYGRVGGRTGLREPGFEDWDGSGGAAEFGVWMGGVFEEVIWYNGANGG